MFAVVAVEHGDFVVVDGPQCICHGVDEVAVMRHKQNGAVVFVEHIFEGFTGADIEVIGGFVEDQQIAADEGELCQCNTPALATRQRPNALEDIIAREQKASEEGPCLGLFDEWADAAHFVEDRVGHDQSFVRLGVVVDLDVAPQPGMAAERGQFADHGAHQRCFAAAVDAHQCDALLAAEHQFGDADERDVLVVGQDVADIHAFKDHHLIATALAGLHGEGQFALFFGA